MASSIMHLAVTNELIKKYTFKDINRLKFGAVLPDAGQKQAGHINKSPWRLQDRWHRQTHEVWPCDKK